MAVRSRSLWKHPALRRVPLLFLGMAALVAATWGGLLRIAVSLPLPIDSANWITFHGPLMVCGFLGTLISLERAVGLRQLWTYSAPVLTGAGAVVIWTGGLGGLGPSLITAGSAVFLAVSMRVIQLSVAPFTIVMGLGSAAWLLSNILWVLQWPFPRLVPWWIAFLALIIVGERLDLSRFQKQERLSFPLFIGALALFMTGTVLTVFFDKLGQQVLGAGLVALAAWLSRFDIARRTIRQPGLPRFMAVCLFSGYFWMALAGVLFLWRAPMEAGVHYDAALHGFFLGFVFGMIFAHAPVIFPAVLERPVAYTPRFYAHVVLLQLSLALRIAGDLTSWNEVRQWGAILNAVALGLFLLNTVQRLLWSPRPATTARGPSQ